MKTIKEEKCVTQYGEVSRDELLLRTIDYILAKGQFVCNSREKSFCQKIKYKKMNFNYISFTVDVERCLACGFGELNHPIITFQ